MSLDNWCLHLSQASQIAFIVCCYLLTCIMLGFLLGIAIAYGSP
uniref:Uncharacterized protein n=1 Tax=Arundo donax TaxID=35708 RepID=A0A0A8Z9T0_ARUDO